MPRQEGLTYGSGVKSEYVRLELHRKQMIEREQHDEQHQAKAKADADQLLLHGQQGLDITARCFRFQIRWVNLCAKVTPKVTLLLPV